MVLCNTGVKGAQAAWGNAFDWCGYLGLIGNERVGATLMPDPAGLRPSWFQNRDYGLIRNPAVVERENRRWTQIKREKQCSPRR